ncbi:MAG: hypothetical protein JK586_07815 [Nocardiopsis sp. BM-2018]|nr:MAG: hypothetical protein JK586_07815 [Nocardiopsis sp. BM-2018]
MTASGFPPAIRYLPLLPRTRPPALPPDQRVAELRGLLCQAVDATDAYDGLVAASEAMNKAALLASDIGLPDLASDLCWQHYDLFTPAVPLTAKVATLALQPVVNLGRLSIRTGDLLTAYTVFEALLVGAAEGRAKVLGRSCQVGDLVSGPDQRAELCRFAWMVLLADGTRALCAADRWQDVVDHLHRHNGIGRRLWDGRQVAVLAALHLHDPEAATVLLEETECKEAWERAVAASLTTATCLVAESDPADAITTMADAVINLPPTLGGEVFAVRLALLAYELAPEHYGLTTHLVTEAIETTDARAALAVLDSPVLAAQLTTNQRNALRTRVEQAELTGAGRSGELETALREICGEAGRILPCRLRGDRVK